MELDLPATVTDGVLTLVLRQGAVELPKENDGVSVSTIAIAPDLGTPRITVDTTQIGPLAASKSTFFYAAGWYLPNAAVSWSVHPALGSIDPNGVYTAPADPPADDTVLTVLATSVARPEISGTVSLTLAGRR